MGPVSVASLRKMVKHIEMSQRAEYACSFCSKIKMKRGAVETWHCHTGVKMAADVPRPTVALLQPQ